MAKGSADTSLVKQGYSKTEYDADQLKDFQACCDPVTGPMYFIKEHMMIQHPVKGAMKMDPYDYQEDLVENYNNYRFSINMLADRWVRPL